MYSKELIYRFLLANLFRESFKQFQRDSKIAIDTNIVLILDNIKILIIQILSIMIILKIFNYATIQNMVMKSFKIGTILNKKGLIQSLNS